MTRFSKALITFVILSSGWLLASYTASNGWDFTPAHTAASGLYSGIRPYQGGLDSGWTFKYPPWTLPIFMPLGLFPLAWAKWIWGVLQALCIYSTLLWVLRNQVRASVAWMVFGVFWWIWMYHCLSGQFTIVMLSLALWSLSLGAQRKPLWDRLRPALAVWALSGKVFSALPLVTFFVPELRERSRLSSGVKLNWDRGVIIVAVLLALTLPALWVTPGHSLIQLFKDYLLSAGSSALGHDNEVFHGRRNQGLPAIFLRAFSIDVSQVLVQALLFLVFAISLGLLWKKTSRNLKWNVKWAGWLALVAIVHPMSWFHSFVFAFPLACFALDEAIGSRFRPRLMVVVAGILSITVITRNTLGPIGEWLELVSIKSLGVLCCLISFKISKRKAATTP